MQSITFPAVKGMNDLNVPFGITAFLTIWPLCCVCRDLKSSLDVGPVEGVEEAAGGHGGPGAHGGQRADRGPGAHGPHLGRQLHRAGQQERRLR